MMTSDKSIKATSLDRQFAECYSTKINDFISTIEGETLTKIPEPFLPVYGKGYADAPVRIMFMGWETRGGNGLEEFVQCAKVDMNDALYWFSEEFDDFQFVYWRTNLSNDFWSFNLRFLAKFHGVANWKELINDTETHEHILNSFAWANCDAIERHHVTAQRNGVPFADWQKIKDASAIFDSPHLIFSTIEPDIILLLHWNKEEDWLLNGLEIINESEPNPYLWHYNCKLNGRHMQLFWTYHPRAMPAKGINYNAIIEEIISIYKMNITS